MIASSAISQNEADVRDIARKSFEQADVELNKAYQDLIKGINSQAFLTTEIKNIIPSDLKQSQRAWVTFRDAESKLRAGLSSQGGSGYSMDYIATKSELTQQRIKELKGFIKSL